MVSLRQCWITLADELGDYAPFVSTSTSADADLAERQVIASSLINDAAGPRRYAFNYLYALDGALVGTQRIVREAGFDGDTGTLSVTADFASIPLLNTNWALLSRFPVIRHENKPGLKEFVNRALSEMAVEDYITFAGVTDQTLYELPLSTYWWIGEKGRCLDLHVPHPNATDKRRGDSQTFDILFDGETPQIQLSRLYNTGDTFEMRVQRPGNSLLKIGGTWTNQTTPLAGLVNDSDEALPGLNINDIVTVAKEYAYHSMTMHGPADLVADWEKKYQIQRNLAGVLKFMKQPEREIWPVVRLSGSVDMGAFR